MRMRKKKHGGERLHACRAVLLDKPSCAMKNPSYETFGAEKSVFLEIGAGKGGFAIGMTKKYPECAYFAMERVSDCVVLAAEKAVSDTEREDNLRFIVDTADNLKDWFCNETVDKIFLNFSDPWSKKGYAKRRLTHRRYLAEYIRMLKPGGTLTFKTDNVGLFDFSLSEIEEVGLTLNKVTRDLHSSEYNFENVMTEYETAFSAQGVKICMLEFTKTEDYTFPLEKLLKQKREMTEE